MNTELFKNPWTTLKSEIKYSNPWIEVTEHEVLNPKGGQGIYGVVHFKNIAIGIIALTENNEIYLVGQYRYPHQKYSWEIVEGGGKHGIDPLESAKKELLEEIGMEALEWKEFMRMDLSNSVSDEYSIVYVARSLKYIGEQPEDTEQLTIKKIPFKQALEMVLNGEITDSISVAAILKYALLENIS